MTARIIERLLRGTVETGRTLAVGGAGGAVFHVLGFPAAFLAGPAVAVTVAIIAGARLSIPVPLRNACFLAIGINIGATVTPDVLRTAITWPLSFAVMTASLLLSLSLCRAMLWRLFGFDRVSAMLAATPGHLSYVIGLTSELRGDASRIAIVQSMRVLFLIVLVPVLLALWGVDGAAAPPPPAAMAPVAITATTLAAALAAHGLARARVPAAWLLGGILVSGLGHATTVAPGQVPGWVLLVSFTVMGSLIGTRFRGQSLSGLRRDLAAGIAVTGVSCGVAALGALGVAALLGLSPALLLISFAPGGVEVMAAMAVQIGVEPTVVAAHHVVRLLVLTAVIPALLARARAADAGRST